jgi:hypothetical protein
VNRKKKVELPEVKLAVTPLQNDPQKFLAVATNCTTELNRDTINLNSAAARKRFITGTVGAALGDKPDPDQAAALAKDLEQRLLALAAAPPGPAEPPAQAPATPPEDPRVAELAKMPEGVRAEAEALLLDPKLLERVSADVGALGVVGEENNRKLLYLVGTSAQLARPLAVITRGASPEPRPALAATYIPLSARSGRSDARRVRSSRTWSSRHAGSTATTSTRVVRVAEHREQCGGG